MKPAWDKLMAEFAESKTALIGDVDCTAAGKELCTKIGVQGYPTLKHGDPNNLEDYKGGRDYDALYEFATENLGPTCGPNSLDLCSDEKKKEINELKALGEETLQEKVDVLEKQIKDAESSFDKKLKELQNTYEKIQKAKDDDIAAAKAEGLGLMKSVLAALKAGGGGEAEGHDEL